MTARSWRRSTSTSSTTTAPAVRRCPSSRTTTRAYDAPRLLVRLLRDSGGTPYLLLHGPEPDNRWEAFARAVREVVERLRVTRVVSMGSVPMAVPHTRPIAITPHANRSELVPGVSPWRGELRIPSSAQSLLEIRLGEWGHDMLGFVAHIPHYLAQLDYPQASAVLLERVELAGRLTVDLSELRALAEEREEEIARYLSANEEVGEVVEALERQYDAFERAEESGSSLLADDQPLPTGDEIGRQFEQFLAGLDDPDPGRQDYGVTQPLAPTTSEPDPHVRDLVALLDLEDLDVDLYRGTQPDSPRPRVYGGQVAAQALVAAVRSVDPEFHVHSFHSYFLLPGDYSVPIVYEVERIRDGRSFLTRRVMARQHGRPIYYQTVNFQRVEEGYDHQDAMPEVGGTDEGFDLVDLMRDRGNAEADALGKEWGAIEVRFLGNSRHGLPRTRSTRPRPGCGSGSSRASPTTPWSTSRRSPTPATSACSAPRSPRTTPTRRPPRWPRWTTRSGSTSRSGPTSGGSTTSGPRARSAAAGSRSGGSSPRTATWSPRSRRRA